MLLILTVLVNSSYEGQYVRGVREGNGTFHYPDGSKYQGQWKGGVRCGHGKYTYANGDWYSGTWKQDMKDGSGVYYHKAANSKYIGTRYLL